MGLGALEMRLPEVTSGERSKTILAARAKAPSVARKLTFRCAHVVRWGVAAGCVEANLTTAGREERATAHRKALPYSEVAGCLEAVRASKAQTATKLAVEFPTPTAARPGEVRAATWAEINFHGATDAAKAESGTREVPVGRMKMKRAHRVPLGGLPHSATTACPGACP